MIDRSALKGIVTPMITPLRDDGQTVHERGVHQLVERLIQQGGHGVFVAGTTGEAWALSDIQWELLVRYSVEACRGRVPLYVGVSHPSTAGAVARARQAEKLGADVVVSLPPYYLPSNQANVIRHFRAIAQATGLPVLIYQFPAIAKVSLALPTYLELANIPNIVGVKDSQADVTQFRQMIRALRAEGRDMRLFLGSDSLTDVVVLMGGQGTVPSLGNIAAQHLVEAFNAAEAGDWARSAAAQAKANLLSGVYDVAAPGSIFDGFIVGLKGALNLLGIEVGPPAAPQVACSAEQLRTIEQILRHGSLLEAA